MLDWGCAMAGDFLRPGVVLLLAALVSGAGSPSISRRQRAVTMLPSVSTCRGSRPAAALLPASTSGWPAWPTRHLAGHQNDLVETALRIADVSSDLSETV